MEYFIVDYVLMAGRIARIARGRRAIDFFVLFLHFLPVILRTILVSLNCSQQLGIYMQVAVMPWENMWK